MRGMRNLSAACATFALDSERSSEIDTLFLPHTGLTIDAHASRDHTLAGPL